MRLLLLGAVFGVAGALALTRLLEGVLFVVTARDPLAFVTAILILVGVGATAVFLPARRATEVDPLVALRQE